MRQILERASKNIGGDFYSANEIIHYFKEKEIDKDWSLCEIPRTETSKWTHNYHRYPAKFIPQLVEKLMDEYVMNVNSHINDPFMGCGTTIVSALSRGYKASGTDINHIAYLITKVKSTPIEPTLLKSKVNQFLKQLSFLEDNQISIFTPSIEPLIPSKYRDRIDYWFTEDNKYDLGVILRTIYNEENINIRDFYLVAFSHILKNCSLWLQSSTKPTRDLNKKPSRPYFVLKNHLMKMLKGNEDFYNFIPDKVKINLNEYLNISLQDARKQSVDNETVDLIITSSPYVTSYEYADLHQLSDIWLYFTDDLTEYKTKFIGTSYKKYDNINLSSLIAKNIVSQMSLVHKKKAKEIEAFYIDMEEVFNESYRILKKGGRCCFVIGNTKYKGIDVLNAEVFAESLQYAGFILDRIIKREIPSKILPQKRDEKTGRFASNSKANCEAYPVEYIIIGLKE